MLLSISMPPPGNAEDGQNIEPADATSATLAATPLPATPSSPRNFSGNTFAYSYGQKFRNPFIASASRPEGADIARQSFTFTHVDAWRYGHNLVDLIFKKSNIVEPAKGGTSGAQELYAIIRSAVSINRVAGRPILAPT
jgi:hypothetical protein